MAVPSVIVDEVVNRLSDLAEHGLSMLFGVKDDFDKLKTKLKSIRGVLEDAEIKGFQDPAVRRWLDELKDIVFDIEDIIDDFSQNLDKSKSPSSSVSPPPLKKVKNFISQKVNDIGHLYNIGKRIQAINDRMEQIHKDRKQFTLNRIEGPVLPPKTMIFQRPETTSGIIESEIFGINKHADKLVQLLTGPNKDGGDRVFAIVGMGGIGKTTLAQKIYNNGRIQSHFQKRIWVCVSKCVNEIGVLKEIIYQAGGQCGEASSKETLTLKMNEVLTGKRFLVVLDDLWSDKAWACLRVPFDGFTADSWVLITTRKREVATQMGAVHPHEMEVLSDDDAWSVLCKVVNQGRDPGNIDQSMKEVGMKIVKKCKGLPLAIKVIGGVLKGKERTKTTWELVLSSDIWSNPSFDIAPELLLSFMELPSYLKPCFLYCSLFPEDEIISRTALTRMWIAEGFVKEDGQSSMEERAEMYHQELVARSLLQFEWSNFRLTPGALRMEVKCKMHDLVRDMAISLTRGFHSLQQDSRGASLKTRRLSISRAEQLKELKEIPLRSLLFFRGWEIRMPQDLFVKLKYIRVLNLPLISIDRLPDAIGKLAQLRYLDISYTDIAELPDSLCNLQYLQTLLLQGCRRLTKLPTDLRRLQALRHLTIEKMPAGIGQLFHLQTLITFKIQNNHQNDGGEGPHDDDGCDINELGPLSQLRYLEIKHLENVRSGAEAKKAAMQDKTHLRYLRLTWNTSQSQPDERAMMEAFEELCPPSSIQMLQVDGFPGRELPRRMTSLENLIHLKMVRVKNLQRLPALGLLPQLKELHISYNEDIKIIGSEFIFGEGGRRGGGGAFPKLEVLYFKKMEGWEEWRDGMEEEEEEERGRIIIKGDGGGGVVPVDILPRLTSLKLIECPNLRSLPMSLLRHATNLTHLKLYDVAVKDIGGLVHVRELELTNCTKLESLWILPALERLEVTCCYSLKDMTNLGVSSLTHIKFTYSSDNNIEALKGVNVTDETRLVIDGFIEVIRKCIPELNGPYWPTIQRFPHVEVQTWDFDDYYFSYTKSTSEFKYNLPPEFYEVNVE